MRALTVILAATLATAPAHAQQQPPATTIDPGMTKAQVVERLGKPGIERSRGTFTYLFYSNGIERRVGMNDIVVLDGDKVIDAIFRSPRRSYSGTSSSPVARTAQQAARENPSKGTLKTDTLPPHGRETKP
jgi:outer membrane protein assembly factor BamE (lipoprotein component of BamABCDE complex)